MCNMTKPGVSHNVQHSFDIPQGGLEIPCYLTFNRTVEDISKIKIILMQAPKEATATGISPSSTSLLNPNYKYSSGTASISIITLTCMSKMN